MSERPYALVTGGASGIGRAITGRLAEDGFHVVVADLNEALAGEVAAGLRAGGLSAEARGLDVTDEAAVARLVADLPPLRALVNNAGLFRDRPFETTGAEDFRRAYEVNTIAPFLLAKAALTRMEAGARIVNIASRAYLGARNQVDYVASKGGVVSLTRALAMEVIRRGILVNAVAPGLIDTPLLRQMTPERIEAQLALQPTGRAGRPEDVANAVSFLVSPRTAFITGQVLFVDGGKSLGGTAA
ncbi:3-oxoacyl-[acyl-carrier-protein] reductase FabG [Methylobacterium crusticola]|uniref:3-oxoacyl-[acyl-carrier-protein] reductase FabG n=1 Tax=Methylobacterium crusticola TaxID=1697972 RepID=A0ABQ4QYF6_9HYPH|nr:SDR family NAD(P)-dependent oxidoreductase [Methylobacterium crusticola]GJD50249.1 3-oxoacyl-[acyl-carrier-protein] reductase FabG [Methylobacterium crusticola]